MSQKASQTLRDNAEALIHGRVSATLICDEIKIKEGNANPAGDGV